MASLTACVLVGTSPVRLLGGSIVYHTYVDYNFSLEIRGLMENFNFVLAVL